MRKAQPTGRVCVFIVRPMMWLRTGPMPHIRRMWKGGGQAPGLAPFIPRTTVDGYTMQPWVGPMPCR